MVVNGLDVETLLFLERHETRVHAIPARQVRDLGDAVLLHDPFDREPFWNRVAAIRWPVDGAAFDRRVDETIMLFATLDRRPHLWPRPILREPADIVERLLAAGFDDVGAGMIMILDRPNALTGRDSPTDGSVTVERLHAVAGPAARAVAADVALVLVEAFEAEPERRPSIEAEMLAWLDHPDLHVCLIRVDGEPAAVAKRATFDGATYLSSIGTRPVFRGRGLGGLVTAIAARDGIAAGSRWTHLGVYSRNDEARRVYERLGFAPVGGDVPDLILRGDR
jgi:ribosomal protein S18 acetylase RimI-like enzyme